MREAIGGTWLFQIVIVFILLFTGFMCLTINRSKAFNVKDQIVQTIQNHNGIDLSGYNGEEESAFGEIISYIKDNSYRTTGAIPAAEKVGSNGETVEYQCYNREGKKVSSNPVFCIARIPANTDSVAVGDQSYDEFPEMYYYRVVVFYQLDLPVFHDLFNFKVVGDTKTLYGGYL